LVKEKMDNLNISQSQIAMEGIEKALAVDAPDNLKIVCISWIVKIWRAFEEMNNE